MKNLVILAVLVANLITNSSSQLPSVCSYEVNIDYANSVDITYLYTIAPQFCCTICAFQPGCVG